MVLPGMKERGRGVIINVGSGAASVIPASPLLSGESALLCLTGVAAAEAGCG